MKNVPYQLSDLDRPHGTTDGKETCGRINLKPEPGISCIRCGAEEYFGVPHQPTGSFREWINHVLRR